MSTKKLIQDVAAATGESQAKIKGLLDAVGAAITSNLQGAQEVTIPRIGKLKPAVRAARTGRNPATGAAVDIVAKTVVKFTASAALKDALN